MNENTNTSVVPVDQAEIDFLATLAQKLDQDGEALVQTDEDTETTPEVAAPVPPTGRVPFGEQKVN